jgi:hypothetical protein
MRGSDRELLLSVFDGLDSPLAIRCAAWIARSGRFRAFLDEYRAKIAKKARTLESIDTWPDLWLELWTAARLLTDWRFALVYEQFSAQRARGPDLTATFRTSTTLHIEIKRPRVELSAAKWTEILCSKFGQLQPSAANVLLVGSAADITETCAAATAIYTLSRAAERGEDATFQRYGMPAARDFTRQLPRLSAILRATDWDLDSAANLTLWLNPGAKHPLPTNLAHALTTLPAG